MTDRESNLAPVAPVGDSAATQSTADSMEGVVLESGSFENTANASVDNLFEEQPGGDIGGTELVVIKDGDTDNDLDEENGVVARVQRQTYVDFLSSPIVMINVGSPPDGTTLSVHLALLLRSPYMADICRGYSHSTPQPDRVVDLPSDDLDAVVSFLQYLYTDEYSPRLVPNPQKHDDTVLEPLDPDLAVAQKDEDGSHLLKHARIYTLAEKLGMEELKTLAHAKIHKINSTARGELEYARYVYANTPKEDKTIRTPIATYWAHKSHVLRHQAEDEFRRMILEFPQFAYDMLSIVLDHKEKGKTREPRQEDREGTELMAPPGTAEKQRGSARKRPRTSSIL